MTDSGLFYIENGFRPSVVKRGYKWSYVLFMSATRIKCKRVRNVKLGKPHHMIGTRPYNTSELALRFLSTDKIISNNAKSILRSMVQE